MAFIQCNHVVQEVSSAASHPALGLVRTSRRSLHPTGDASLGKLKTEHAEFPMDPRCSQVGFSATIWKINSRISLGVCFLPTCLRTLEISLQYIRKPARCQRTPVSGVRTRRACFHPDQTHRAITQKSLSSSPRLGRGCRRFNIRVADAKRDSREGDFAACERGGPASPSRA